MKKGLIKWGSAWDAWKLVLNWNSSRVAKRGQDTDR